MRVRINRRDTEDIDHVDMMNSQIEEESDKVLVSKDALDRLIIEVITELLNELDGTKEVMEDAKQVERACAARGFHSLLKFLRITNAINASEKGKLYKK